MLKGILLHGKVKSTHHPTNEKPHECGAIIGCS
jgi:hypothetical protein